MQCDSNAILLTAFDGTPFDFRSLNFKITSMWFETFIVRNILLIKDIAKALKQNYLNACTTNILTAGKTIPEASDTAIKINCANQNQ